MAHPRFSRPKTPTRLAKSAIFGATLAISGLLATQAVATEVGSARPVGVGFAVGEPTGIVGKMYVGPENAWDAGLSFFNLVSNCRVDDKWEPCSSKTNLSINVDYLWQYTLLQGEAKLSWHFGAGGRAWLFSADSAASNLALAARMPLGLDLAFRKPEFVEVFLEFTPALFIYPGIGFNLEPAIGIRFFF